MRKLFAKIAAVVVFALAMLAGMSPVAADDDRRDGLTERVVQEHLHPHVADIYEDKPPRESLWRGRTIARLYSDDDSLRPKSSDIEITPLVHDERTHHVLAQVRADGRVKVTTYHDSERRRSSSRQQFEYRFEAADEEMALPDRPSDDWVAERVLPHAPDDSNPHWFDGNDNLLMEDDDYRYEFIVWEYDDGTGDTLIRLNLYSPDGELLNEDEEDWQYHLNVFGDAPSPTTAPEPSVTAQPSPQEPAVSPSEAQPAPTEEASEPEGDVSTTPTPEESEAISSPPESSSEPASEAPAPVVPMPSVEASSTPSVSPTPTPSVSETTKPSEASPSGTPITNPIVGTSDADTVASPEGEDAERSSGLRLFGWPIWAWLIIVGFVALFSFIAFMSTKRITEYRAQKNALLPAESDVEVPASEDRYRQYEEMTAGGLLPQDSAQPADDVWVDEQSSGYDPNDPETEVIRREDYK